MSLLFICSLALLGYAYVGYPLLVRLLGRLFPSRLGPGRDRKRDREILAERDDPGAPVLGGEPVGTGNAAPADEHLAQRVGLGEVGEHPGEFEVPKRLEAA